MSKDNTTHSNKSLADIRNSVRERLETLAHDSEMPDEFRAVFDELEAYHEALDNREKSMRGALMNLVDDMSRKSQALTETGTRLEGILEAAQGVGFIIAENEDDTIIEFSRGAENIFGYDRSEALSMQLQKLCCCEAGSMCCGGEQSNSRHTMRRKSGVEFPAVYSSYQLRDSNDWPYATLVIVLDNSRQELTEKLFRDSNRRYQALAMAAPISIITFDATGTINFVNDWHLRTFDNGRVPVEFYLGKKVNQLPNITQAGVQREVLAVLEGRTVSLEDVHVPAFGVREEGWQNIRLSPLMHEGEVVGGILLREDVTRRKQTELDLMMLIDSSPIPLLKIESGLIRDLNPEAEAMLGRSAKNKPLDDYITQLAEEDTELAAMRGDRCEVRTQDGVRQAIRTSHKTSGTFEVQAVMDVSVLIEAKEAAEDASRTKSDFIANMSHEIRTPLNILLGMLQLFADEELNDELAEMVEHATGAGRSLLALLNDILDFSVVEARALALDEQDFSLAEIFELIAAPYRVEAAQKGVDFSYAIDPAMPERLWGDARRLRQSIFHVTSNGVKFTDAGGVLLEAGWAPHADRPGGFVEITVSDSGIGMSKDQMTRIFEPFRQADGTRTRRHGGTGIGLALVHEFVTAMRGDISVESHPGRGSRFRFTVDVGVVGASAS